MTRKKSSKVISKALYSVAKKYSKQDETYLGLLQLTKLVNTESSFCSLVQSKRISGSDKIKILKKVFGDKANFLVIEIISYFSGFDAVDRLNKVFKSFEKEYKQEKNIVKVNGIVSEELSVDERVNFKTTLERILGKKTDLTIIVDKSIIGGIKLRIEDVFLDGSILNQLQSLRAELLQI